jgi:hypothetical protein
MDDHQNHFKNLGGSRAIRYKSSLVPRCGLFATIPAAYGALKKTL